MKDRGVGSGGAMAWFFQRLTGIVLAPVLLIHLLTMHRFTTHGLPWNEVAGRLANPYWKVLEVVFLALALYHGFNGIYSIFQDYVHRPGFRLFLFSLLVLAGVILFGFGIVTALTVGA